MMKYKKIIKVLVYLIVFSVLANIQISVFAQENIPMADYPLLTTSAGQSPDVLTLNIVAEEAGVLYDYCDVPTVELISKGVGLGDIESGEGFHVEIYTDLEKYPKGTPYQTVMFAIGASLKGMGASGLTVADEVARLKKLINYCEENDIFVVAIHVGGVSKRGAPGSDNEKMIDAVAPFADYIIVTSDSNQDGRFTEIAEKNSIDFTEIEFALELIEIFQAMFSVDE
jgi:hypothetical protein